MFPANSKTTKQKSNLTHHYLTAVLALTALITSPQIKAEDDFTGLGFLPGGETGYSYARGASDDGSVVVGYARNAGSTNEAFRWVDGTMIGLGFLPNAARNYSSALGVSADGSVVVGHGINAYSQTEAFRWVDGTMTGLGFLPSFTNSYANAISADGSVVVGYSDSGIYNGKAFRWTLETGMESVEDWLSNAGVSIAAWSTLKNANGTNSDGSVVVGSGVNANGDEEAFIARVGYSDGSVVVGSGDEEASGVVGSGDEEASGVVGLTDLSNSLASQVSPSQTLDTLTSMALNGAHHRPLTDIAMSDGEHCVWASADLGRIHRNGKGWTSLKEVGGCHDFVDNTVRVGVGVGHSRASINQSLGGSSRLHGKYALVEMDWTIPNSALVASVLGMTGRWEADIRRGYSAGTSTSTGDTDMESSSLRARVDWRDAFSLGAVSFSPSVQYTHTSTRIDGYQETGGTSPARFDSQHNKAKESRVALQGAYEYSAKTTLLGRTEWAHRFDSKGASVSGSANILNAVNMPFNIKGNDVEQDWVRVAAEVVHRFSRSNRLSLSTTAASVGQDADFSVGANWTMLF